MLARQGRPDTGADEEVAWKGMPPSGRYVDAAAALLSEVDRDKEMVPASSKLASRLDNTEACSRLPHDQLA